MENEIKLSGRELDIMNVFWEAEKPMIAKDIVARNPSLSINTVQAVLKGLLKKNYIKVSEIVYSGTVLTRSYEPVLTAEGYTVNLLTKGIHKHISSKGIMAALLKQEENEEKTIEKLEELLKEYKENSKKG